MRPKWFVFPAIILFLSILPRGGVRAEPEKTTAFVNVNLIPMTEEKIVTGQTVLVRGTKISAVGPFNHVQVPKGSLVIDGTNLYLLPGLADMHIHTDTRWLNGGWPVSPLNLFLANGVTTIRDFGPKGTPTDHALYWRKEINKGRLQGPRIYAAGPILYGPVENAKKTVQDQKKKGFDFVKLYSFLSKREFHDAMEAAKVVNVHTAGHIPFAVGLEGVLAAGMKEIAHIEELDFEFLKFDRSRTLGHWEWFQYILQKASRQMGPLADLSPDELRSKYKDEIKNISGRLKKLQTPVCTTLTVDDIVVKKLFHPKSLASMPTARYLPYGFLKSLRQGKNRHQIQFRGHEDFAPFHFKLNKLLLRELRAGGVELAAGTDSGPLDMGLVPGFSLHDELSIMIKNGFTPYEALKTATVNAANVVHKMKGKGNFGTIEVGKRADLLMIRGNPLEDIAKLKRIQGVMASGRWLDKSTLQEMIVPKIPVTAAVKHVHNQGKEHHTYFDVIIGKAFSGDLPDAIDSIIIRGPDGRLPIGKKDFTYLRRLRNFWIKLPGIPVTGTYAIEVKSKRSSGLAVDILGALKTLPLPDVQILLPRNGAVLKSDERLFSWETAETEGPLYYRMEINELNGGRIYSTGHVKNMRSHKVPKNLLKPGGSYRWRLRITDGARWQDVQNSSRSSWQVFHVK